MHLFVGEESGYTTRTEPSKKPVCPRIKESSLVDFNLYPHGQLLLWPSKRQREQ
jgi:hypothetical protein